MEADDVIATLARRGEERGLDVFIVTADKDARQLISDQIRISTCARTRSWTPPASRRNGASAPTRSSISWRSTGDSVDNVPGVPGIGEGFASTFLKQFGTLDNLLANLGQVKGPKKQQSLREHEETARRARQLVTLQGRPPAGPRLGCAQNPGPRRRGPESALRPSAAFTGFATSWAHSEANCPAAKNRPGRPSITPSTRPRASRRSSTSCERQPRFCIDTETTAIDPLRADLVGLSFCWKPGEAYYLPVRGPAGSHAARRGGDPRGPAAHLDRPGRSRRSARTSSTTCWRSGARASTWPARSPTRWSCRYLLESGERNHNLDQLVPAAARPHDDPDHRLDRQRKEPGADGPGRRRPGRRVRRRRCRRDLADRRRSCRPRCASEGLWDLYAELERPLDLGAGADGDRPESRSTSRGSSSSRANSPSGSRRSRPRFTRWPAGPSTSTRARSSARCSSTS